MQIKSTYAFSVAILLLIAGFSPAIYSQTRKSPVAVPRIDVLDYKIEVELIPDAHEFTAAASITLNPLESTDIVVFELNENIWIEKVLDENDIELEFAQDEIAPGYLSVFFSPALSPQSNITVRIEFQGGFDRDRFSRLYSRDDGSAYIGMEGTYLMYSAKWFPINDFLADMATATLEVTVPLGMTVIGPGVQLPVVTKGISETFRWNTDVPVLPGSFVAGRYFQKRFDFGDISIDCFARQDNLDAMQSSAEAAAKILEFYGKTYGPSASGVQYRLVEVEDSLARQHGMLGTIFITRRELAQPSPPIRQLARRIAYQWWQETVGVRSASDLWLVDGMAYFSAAQYFREMENQASFQNEIDNLAVLALKFENKSPVRRGLELGFRSDRYESVVAGKGAWVLNMLRGILGDDKFSSLIQKYMDEWAGSGGSTDAFQELSEELYGDELNWFFAQWLDNIGIPDLRTDYVVFKTLNGFRVSGTVRQDRDLFRMPIEISVVSGEKENTITVDLKGKSASFDVNSFSAPQKIVLDPNYKILRDSRELQTSVQISLGNDMKLAGNFVEAMEAYEAALRLTPNRSIAHFRLAEVFFEQFNLQSAANSFRDALNGDRDPAWIEVWSYIYLGKIYDILGQRQRAMAEYTKAVNTKDDTDGAQAEAQKWLAEPFTRERTSMNEDSN